MEQSIQAAAVQLQRARLVERKEKLKSAQGALKAMEEEGKELHGEQSRLLKQIVQVKASIGVQEKRMQEVNESQEDHNRRLAELGAKLEGA